MNKKLAKMIEGKQRKLISVEIILGDGAMGAKCVIDRPLNDLLEKEYGEEYIKIRDKMVEECRKPTETFAEGMKEVMETDEDVSVYDLAGCSMDKFKHILSQITGMSLKEIEKMTKGKDEE